MVDPLSSGARAASAAYRDLRVTGVMACALAAACGGVVPTVPGDTEVVPPGPAAVTTSECVASPPSWLWCDDFEEDRLHRYFEHDDRNGAFVRAAGVGQDASFGMRARWGRAGQVNAGSLKLAFGRTPSAYMRPVDAGIADHQQIFWRIFVRTEPGWRGGGGHKFSRATSLVSSDWAQSMIAHVWSAPREPQWNHLVLDPASGVDRHGELRSSRYNDFENLRWLGARLGATPAFAEERAGRWHCVEAGVRLNGPGRSDGWFRLWVDNRLDTERTDLDWRGPFDAYGLNAVFLENYWNGGAPQAQERHFDRFVVSTERIGC